MVSLSSQACGSSCATSTDNWAHLDSLRGEGGERVLVVSRSGLVAVLELCDFARVGVELVRLVPGSDQAVHLKCAAGIVGAGGLGSAGGSAQS